MSDYGWDPPLQGMFIPKLSATVENDFEVRFEIMWEADGIDEALCPPPIAFFLERTPSSAAFLNRAATLMENRSDETREE